MRRAACLVAFIAVGACSSFGATNTDGGVAADDAGAGSLDAATGDGPTGARDCAGAAFCDDFESGNLARWNPQIIESEGAEVSVRTILRAEGSPTMALVAKTPAEREISNAYAIAAVDSFTGGLAVRARVWFDGPIAGNTSPLALAGHGPDDLLDLDFLYSANIDDGKWELLSRLGQSQMTWGVGASARAKTWYCVEIDAVLTGTNEGGAVLFVDGAQQSSTPRQQPLLGSGPPPLFSALAGLHIDGRAAPQELHVDDVVMRTYPGDTTSPTAPRIGCN